MASLGFSRVDDWSSATLQRRYYGRDLAEPMLVAADQFHLAIATV